MFLQLSPIPQLIVSLANKLARNFHGRSITVDFAGFDLRHDVLVSFLNILTVDFLYNSFELLLELSGNEVRTGISLCRIDACLELAHSPLKVRVLLLFFFFFLI